MSISRDSLLEEMEPRVLRPTLPTNNEKDIKMQAQVSEPSLFLKDNILSPLRNSMNPRSKLCQSSPIKSPFNMGLHTPKASQLYNSDSCSCKASPTIDPELRELIQEQNTQLQMLRKQVEQLLSYQEKFQKKNEDDKCHNATQTSFLDVPSPGSPINYKQTPPRKTKCPSGPRFSGPERTEFTLTFRDLQLETIVEQPPSPQPSIVVNLHEYPESISEKHENDSISESCSTVMEHVQKLLAQANFTETRTVLTEKSYDNHQNQTRAYGHDDFNPVRKVTMQRVQELGISFVAPCSNTFPRNTAHHQHYSRALQIENRKETDQSVEMKLLAEKYLGQKNNFLSRIDQPQSNRKPVEMSMSTQQYLERYGLVDNNSYFHG